MTDIFQRQKDIALAKQAQQKAQQQSSGVQEIVSVEEQIAKAPVEGRFAQYIKLDNGEYVSKESFNRLDSESQKLLKTKGVDAYKKYKAQSEVTEEDIAKNNVKLKSGEWIDKTAYNNLSKEEQDRINNLGIEEYNKYLESQYIKLDNGEYVSKESFGKLDTKSQEKLKKEGIVKFNEAIKTLSDYEAKELKEIERIEQANRMSEARGYPTIPIKLVPVYNNKGELLSRYSLLAGYSSGDGVFIDINGNKLIISDKAKDDYFKLSNTLPEGWSLSPYEMTGTLKSGSKETGQTINIARPDGRSITLGLSNALNEFNKSGTIKIPDQIPVPAMKKIEDIVDKGTYTILPPAYQGQATTWARFNKDGIEYNVPAYVATHYANAIDIISKSTKYKDISAPTNVGSAFNEKYVVNLTDKDGKTIPYEIGEAWNMLATDGKYGSDSYVPPLPEPRYGESRAAPSSLGGSFGQVTGTNVMPTAYQGINVPLNQQVGMPQVTDTIELIKNVNAGLIKEGELTQGQRYLLDKHAIKLATGDYTDKQAYAEWNDLVVAKTGDMISKPYFDTFNDAEKTTIIQKGVDALLIKLPGDIEIKKTDFDRLNNVWQETLYKEGKTGYDKLINTQTKVIKELDSKYKQGDGYNLAKYMRDNHIDGINNLVIAGFTNRDIKDAVIVNNLPSSKETPIEIYQSKMIEKTNGRYNDVNTLVTNPIEWSNFNKEYPKLATEFKKLMDNINESAIIRDKQKTEAPISLDKFTEEFALSRGKEGVTQVDISSIFDKDKNNIRTLAALAYKDLYGDKASNKAIVDNSLQFVFAPARALKPEVKLSDITPWEWTIGAAQALAMGGGAIGGAIGKVAPLAGKAVGIGTQAGATTVFSIDTAMNWNNMNQTQQALSLGFDFAMFAGTLGSIKGGIKGKQTSKNIDTASTMINKGIKEAKPELVNQGVKILKDNGIKQADINKVLSSEPLKSINDTNISAEPTISKFSKMDLDTFDKLSNQGRIKPFGEQVSDVKAVVNNEKPLSIITKGLEYEEALKYAKKKGLEVKEVPVTTGEKGYAIYKKGNDYLLDKYYDILIKYNAGIKAPPELNYNMAYHIEIGKLLGYADADIAKYIKNFGELPELKKYTTNPQVKSLLDKLNIPERGLKLESEITNFTLDPKQITNEAQVKLLDKLNKGESPIITKKEGIRIAKENGVENPESMSIYEIAEHISEIKKGIYDIAKKVNASIDKYGTERFGKTIFGEIDKVKSGEKPIVDVGNASGTYALYAKKSGLKLMTTPDGERTVAYRPDSKLNAMAFGKLPSRITTLEYEILRSKLLGYTDAEIKRWFDPNSVNIEGQSIELVNKLVDKFKNYSATDIDSYITKARESGINILKQISKIGDKLETDTAPTKVKLDTFKGRNSIDVDNKASITLIYTAKDTIAELSVNKGISDVYINGKPVTGTTSLIYGDYIRVGDKGISFIPKELEKQLTKQASEFDSEIAKMNNKALKQMANITRNKDVILAMNTINEGLSKGNINIIRRGGQLLVEAGKKVSKELGGEVISRKGELVVNNPEQLIKMTKGKDIPFTNEKITKVYENVSKEASDLLLNIDNNPSQIPAFVSKNFERILRDNKISDIDINSKTPSQLIDTLRSKAKLSEVGREIRDKWIDINEITDNNIKFSEDAIQKIENKPQTETERIINNTINENIVKNEPSIAKSNEVVISSTVKLAEEITNRYPQTRININGKEVLNYYLSGSLSPTLLSKADRIVEVSGKELKEGRIIELSPKTREKLSLFARKVGDIDFVVDREYMKSGQGIKNKGGLISYDDLPQSIQDVLNREKNQTKVMFDPLTDYTGGKYIKATINGKNYYLTSIDEALAYKLLHALESYEEKPIKFNNDFRILYEVANDLYTKQELINITRKVLSEYEKTIRDVNVEFGTLDKYTERVPELTNKLLKNKDVSTEIKTILQDVLPNKKVSDLVILETVPMATKNISYFDSVLNDVIKKVDKYETNPEIKNETIKALDDAKGKVKDSVDFDSLLNDIQSRANELDVDSILMEAQYSVTPNYGDVVRVDNKLGHISDVVTDAKNIEHYYVEYWDKATKPTYVSYEKIIKVPYKEAIQLVKEYKKEGIISKLEELREKPPEEPLEPPKGGGRKPPDKPPEIPPFEKGRTEFYPGKSKETIGEESAIERGTGYERMKDYPGYYEHGESSAISPIKQLDTTINPWDLTSRKKGVAVAERIRMVVEAPVREPEVKPKKAPVKTEPLPKKEPKVEPIKEPSVAPKEPIHEPIKVRPFEPIPEKSPMHEPIPEVKPWEKVEPGKKVEPTVAPDTGDKVIPTPEKEEEGEEKGKKTTKKDKTVIAPAIRQIPKVGKEPEIKPSVKPASKMQVTTMPIQKTSTIQKVKPSGYPQPQPISKAKAQIQEAVKMQLVHPVPKPTPIPVPRPIPKPIPQPQPKPNIPTPVPTPPPPPPPPPPPIKIVGNKIKGLTKEQKKGIVAWKQGFDYILKYPPYGKPNTIHSRKPLAGVKYYDGVGSAAKSIVAKYGNIPPLLADEMGIMSFTITSSKETRKPTLKFATKPNIKRKSGTYSSIKTVRAE